MLGLIRHYQLDIMLMLGSVCLALAYNLSRRPLPADTWTIDAAGGRRPHLQMGAFISEAIPVQ